jgi:hypothetical protein
MRFPEFKPSAYLTKENKKNFNKHFNNNLLDINSI